MVTDWEDENGLQTPNLKKLGLTFQNVQIVT